MKKIILMLLCLTPALHFALGTNVDVRLVRYFGKAPPDGELLRLMKSDAIPYFSSFSATVDPQGKFSYNAITPVEYPTDFDANGKWLAKETRNTGPDFSGKSVRSADGYELSFRFRDVSFMGSMFYPLKSGAHIAQPVFSTANVTSGKAEVIGGEWTVHLLPALANDNSHLVLFVRIHE